MIHQEFFTSPSLTKCSLSARLLFIAMLIHADDEGHCRSDPAYWKAVAFPLDGRVGVAKVQADVVKLQAVGCIEAYVNDGVEFFRIPAWKRWQKINNPSAWRVHDPPVRKDYGSPTVALPKDYGSPGVALPVEAQAQAQAQAREPSRGREKSDAGEEGCAFCLRPLKDGDPVHETLQSLHDTFKATTGECLTITPAKDSAALKRLIKVNGKTQPEIEETWVAWLQTDDQFVINAGYTIPLFAQRYNGVRAALKEGKPYGQGHRGRAQANTLPAGASEFTGGDPFAE